MERRRRGRERERWGERERREGGVDVTYLQTTALIFSLVIVSEMIKHQINWVLCVKCHYTISLCSSKFSSACIQLRPLSHYLKHELSVMFKSKKKKKENT